MNTSGSKKTGKKHAQVTNPTQSKSPSPNRYIGGNTGFQFGKKKSNPPGTDSPDPKIKSTNPYLLKGTGQARTDAFNKARNLSRSHEPETPTTSTEPQQKHEYPKKGAAHEGPQIPDRANQQKKTGIARKRLYHSIDGSGASESPDPSDRQQNPSSVRKKLYDHIDGGGALENADLPDPHQKTSRGRKKLYDHIDQNRGSESPEHGPSSGDIRPQSQNAAASGDESDMISRKHHQKKKQKLGHRGQDAGEISSGDDKGHQFQDRRSDDHTQEASEAEEESNDGQQTQRKENKPLGGRIPGPEVPASGSDSKQEKGNPKPDGQEGHSGHEDNELQKKKVRDKNQEITGKVATVGKGVKHDTSDDVEMDDSSDSELESSQNEAQFMRDMLGIVPKGATDAPKPPPEKPIIKGGERKEDKGLGMSEERKGGDINKEDDIDAMLGIVPTASTDAPKPPPENPTIREGEHKEEKDREISGGGEGADGNKGEEGKKPSKKVREKIGGSKKVIFKPTPTKDLPSGSIIVDADEQPKKPNRFRIRTITTGPLQVKKELDEREQKSEDVIKAVETAQGPPAAKEEINKRQEKAEEQIRPVETKKAPPQVNGELDQREKNDEMGQPKKQNEFIIRTTNTGPLQAKKEEKSQEAVKSAETATGPLQIKKELNEPKEKDEEVIKSAEKATGPPPQFQEEKMPRKQVDYIINKGKKRS